MLRSFFASLVLLTLVALPVSAHVGEHPSVHDTVAGIVKRLTESFDAEKLRSLEPEDVLGIVTEEERHVLATEHLTFSVNAPVVVSVIRDMRRTDEPFWLEERGFRQTKLRVVVEGIDFDVWEREFDAGPIGLGINSIRGRSDHYFVAMRAQKRRDRSSLEVTDIYPGLHTRGALKEGALPWSDESDRIASLPADLEGQLFLRGVDDRKRDARMVGVFRTTPYPSSAEPDHVTLTWSGDPKTTQTVQWRTSTATAASAIAFAERDGDVSFNPAGAQQVAATTKPMRLSTLVNDPVIHRHTATITGLSPGTTYQYALSNGQGAWSAEAEFSTAPAATIPFSFIYMGDAQNGLETWGNLIQASFREKPEAKFYVMAGDLIDRGQERDDWDSYFEKATGVLDRRQIVPVPGNHEYQGGNAAMYLEMFTLPDSSPVGEQAYTLEYSNALFVMLDSNIAPHTQTDWLEAQLANSDATWKFVVYHHPAYSSSPNRNNARLRKEWGELFDKYHVDVAMQGHDHAYLRTYPMFNEKPVGTPKEGTIYIVSVSGTKFYDQGDFEYTEFGMTNTSTYQVLDIRIDGNRLEYNAYDVDGTLHDTFVIEK